MFNDNFLDLPLEKFHFEKISYCDLLTITEGMNVKCSPGFDGIPFKVLLENSHKILPFLVLLFNQILTENSIPKDWKCAVVTPLFKSKGSRSECDNYRGISVLSPITKLFEIILSKQLTKL